MLLRGELLVVVGQQAGVGFRWRAVKDALHVGEQQQDFRAKVASAEGGQRVVLWILL